MTLLQKLYIERIYIETSDEVKSLEVYVCIKIWGAVGMWDGTWKS